ncbi:Phospholipase SGR2 [Linum perenne]
METNNEVSVETNPDLLRNTPSNIARLEDVIENSKGRQKYLAQTRSSSDGGDVRWYFCKVPLALRELAASVPRLEVVEKGEYFRFGMRDSLAIEASFLQKEEELLSMWWKEYAECSEGPRGRPSSSNKIDLEASSDLYDVEEERVGVPVKGGLYEVDLVRRHCFPVYWNGENWRALRGHWFARKGGIDWLPVREDVAEQLEVAYRNQVWHRRTFQPSGLFAARVELQGSTPGLHALFMGEDDTWEAWLNADASGVAGIVNFSRNGIKLRRGYSASCSTKPTQDELRQQKEEEMDDYCSQVPVRHLVFMVHGIGQRLEKSNLVDDVGTYRQVTASLAERHLTSNQLAAQRVLFIPCQWRKGLKLSGEAAVEKITLDGVRGLRVMLGATAHDVLYYMSPIYCQDIINSVSNQLNRLYLKFLKRNPGYDGKISLYGHSLGSVLSYDILCHQENLSSPFPMEWMYKEQPSTDANDDSSMHTPEAMNYTEQRADSTDDVRTREKLDPVHEDTATTSSPSLHEDTATTSSPSLQEDTATTSSPSLHEDTTTTSSPSLHEDTATTSRPSLHEDESNATTSSPSLHEDESNATAVESEQTEGNPHLDISGGILPQEEDGLGEDTTPSCNDSVGGPENEHVEGCKPDDVKEIETLKEEIELLKAKIAELESKSRTGPASESLTKPSQSTDENTSTSLQTEPQNYTPYIKYTKLEFQVDTFFAVGSPLGVFLALRNIRIGIGRGKEYWVDENITEEIPACRQMFNIFHPFDPVAYRIEPLVCKEFIDRRPVIIPYHRGGKRLHIGFQEFSEDLAARSQAVKDRFHSVKVLTMCQSRTEKESDETEEAAVEENRERTYGSLMMERLTGSEQGRVDHMLQDKTFEHPYLQAIGAHTNYWRDNDTALFILKHLYRGISDETSDQEEAETGGGGGEESKYESGFTAWRDRRESAEAELPLTFSDRLSVRNFSRRAKKFMKR